MALHSEEILQLAAQVLKAESEAVASITGQLNSSFVEAAELLLACQGHVLVSGSGTSHPVGARLAHLLSCCGTPALFIHPGDSQHGLSGALTRRDVLIVISKGGETTEVISLAKVAKQRGTKLICITEQSGSTLGQMSDIILHIVAPPDVDPFGMIATGSSLVNSACGDALCVVLLKMRDYSLKDFGATHPGGAVGLKLKDIL
jgi:D-arabinose 5-phosphate isomerase GutQ